MFPESVREVITQHLIEIYSNIYTFKTFGDVSTSDIGFTSCIMEVFGGVTSEDGVALGEYSYLAKLLEASDLIGLQEADIKTKSIRARVTPGPAPISMKRLNSHLQEAGWEQVDIERLHVQLNEAHCNFNLMMRRMRQFRAGARLHYIAAQLLALGDGSVVNQNDETIPSHITFMIKEVTRVLEQNDEQDTWRSLVKIQRNQLEGGNRLTLLSQLAAKRNRGEEITADELAQLVASLADGRGHEDAMAMIESQAQAQRENGERISILMKLISELAKVYNAGSNKNTSQLTVQNDPRFSRLVESMGKSEEATLCSVETWALKTNETFWTNFAKLQQYVEENDLIAVDGDDILFVHCGAEGKGNLDLAKWFHDQIGYDGLEPGTRVTGMHWAFNAFEYPGSLEYTSLIGLGATFDPVINRKAHKVIIAKNVADKKRSDTEELQGIRNASLTEHVQVAVSTTSFIPGL